MNRLFWPHIYSGFGKGRFGSNPETTGAPWYGRFTPETRHSLSAEQALVMGKFRTFPAAARFDPNAQFLKN
jgi:hypothetical protein